MNLVVILGLSFVSSAVCQIPNVYEFCSALLNNPTEGSANAACPQRCPQGPPGKRGAAGVRGQPGSKGDRGEEGSCDSLGRKITDLESKVQDNAKKAGINACSIGLKDKKVNYPVIRASARANERTTADFARLDQQPTSSSDGAWCGGAGNWIEVDLQTPHELGGIITQGNPSADNWVTTFTIACREGNDRYIDYTEYGEIKVFSANSNRNGQAFNYFSKKITCRSIKIRPTAWQTRPCLRIELLIGRCSAPIKHEFYIKSQGYEDGNTCEIRINGKQSAVQARGFCVTVFNPKTLAVKAITFDTHAKESEMRRMINYLETVDQYSVVAIAIQDTGFWETRFSAEARLADVTQELGAVGPCSITNIKLRDSYAFVGQKLPSNEERPHRVICQLVPRHGGTAIVHATVYTADYIAG